MSKVVQLLSRSQHRYIIASGKCHGRLPIASNMWSASFVPQKQLLPLVDLLICHNGHNRVVEAFHFGKPTLNISLLWGNCDNAEVIRELDFGAYYEHADIDKPDFLDTIDRLVNDHDLKKRLTLISKRIQCERCIEKAAKLIEQAHCDWVELHK